MLYSYLYLYLYVNFLVLYMTDYFLAWQFNQGEVFFCLLRSHVWGQRAACYAVDLLTFLHTRLVAQFNSSCFAEMAARKKTKQTNKCARDKTKQMGAR